MKDIFRTAVAVPSLKVADIAHNKDAILACVQKAHAEGVAVFIDKLVVRSVTDRRNGFARLFLWRFRGVAAAQANRQKASDGEQRDQSVNEFFHSGTSFLV